MVAFSDDGRAGLVAPERSLVQRMVALRQANEVRVARAERKREMGRLELLVTEVVASPPPEMETMKVFDLLMAVPKIGRVKATAILRQHAISPSKTVAGLSERQRGALAVVLKPYTTGELLTPPSKRKWRQRAA